MSTNENHHPVRKTHTGEPGNPGQFGTRHRTDSPVSLSSSGRTAFGGYELRGFKTAGHGMEGRIWTGTVYRDGKPVVHITEQGDGGAMRLVEKSTGYAHRGPEIDAFRRTAARFFPEYAAAEPEGIFAETLQFSAELDRLARKHGVTRAQVVEDHIIGGEIQPGERLLFTDPDWYLAEQTGGTSS